MEKDREFSSRRMSSSCHHRLSSSHRRMIEVAYVMSSIQQSTLAFQGTTPMTMSSSRIVQFDTNAAAVNAIGGRQLTGTIPHRHQQQRASLTTMEMSVGVDFASGGSSMVSKFSATKVQLPAAEQRLSGKAEEEQEKWISTIKKFGLRKGGWEDVLAALEEAKISGVPMTAKLYHVAMTILCKQRQAALALNLFYEMRTVGGVSSPDKFCFDVAIIANRLLRRRDDALKLLQEMKAAGYAPTPYTYNELIRACRGTTGGLAVADKVFEDILASELTSSSFSVCANMLILLADELQWARAIQLLRYMQGKKVWPDARCYNAAISACRKAGEWKQASDLLQELRSSSIRIKKLAPDRVSYTEAILACIEAGGDTDAALGMLQQLKQDVSSWGEAEKADLKSHMMPIYKALIPACAQTPRLWRVAVDLFNTMRRDGLQPSGRLYRTIIHLLSERNNNLNNHGHNWKEVRNLLLEARDYGERLTVVTYNTVIHQLCRGGQIDQAFEIFREMRKDGILPQVVSYNSLIDGCAKKGDWRTALNLLTEMERDEGLKGDVFTYSSCISACGKAREWEKSLALLVLMRRQGIEPNIICLNAAISACQKAGMWEKAHAMLDTMVQQGLLPDVYTFNIAIAACETPGNFNKAIELLGTLRSQGLTPDVYTYSSLMVAARNNGEPVERLLRLLTDMKAEGIKPNVVNYSEVMTSCAINRRLDKVDEIFQQMRSDGVIPNVHTYSSAITAAERCTEPKMALSYFEAMKSAGLQPDMVAYGALTSAYSRCRMWEEAVDILNQVKLAGLKPNLVVYTSAMAACQRCGQSKQAMTLFKQMRQEGGLTPDQMAFEVAIAACEAMGKMDEALRLHDEMAELNIRADVRPSDGGQSTFAPTTSGGYYG